MFWLEDIGTISTTPLQYNCLGWELPNCFAYQLHLEVEQVVPHIISSPWFPAFNHTWRMALVRNGEGGKDGYGDVGIFLWLKSSFMNEAPNITVKFTLFDSNGKDYKTCCGSVDYNGSFGSWNFLQLAEFSTKLNEISGSGVLRFHCLMEEKPSIKVMQTQSGSSTKSKDNESESDDDSENDEEPAENDHSEPKGITRLVQNLKRLLEDKESCDVLLKVEGCEFRAHKAMLKVRSPVFASMFQYHTKESDTCIVDIPDCSASVFEILLSYLYTGSTDAFSSDNVFGLYYAADKYQVNDLRSDCVEFMKKNLSLDNFFEISELSSQYNELGLQKVANRFCCNKFGEISATAKWQEYMRENPVQANQLLLSAFKEMRK